MPGDDRGTDRDARLLRKGRGHEGYGSFRTQIQNDLILAVKTRPLQMLHSDSEVPFL